MSEYQLAKAAVRAGIKILQGKMGIDDVQIQRILLAGAFGSFMDADDALAADLLPGVPVERVESAGNTAGFWGDHRPGFESAKGKALSAGKFDPVC